MYDVLLISYGANGCLSTLFSYFIYFFQDQMCVSMRVYMCVRGHERAYMFCIWGVMAYIGRVQRMRQVYFACAYCAEKFASKMHHLYSLFLYLFYIFERNQKSQHRARCSSGGSIRGARSAGVLLKPH